MKKLIICEGNREKQLYLSQLINHHRGENEDYFFLFLYPNPFKNKKAF